MSDNKSFKVQNGLDVTGDANVSGSVTATSFIGDGSQLTGISGGGGSSSTVSGTVDGHLIPDANAQYDLGAAEYKFRHLYLSENSVHTPHGALSFVDGNLTFGGEPVMLLSDIQEVAAECDTFEDFKAALASL